jgi:hypothetical protein
MKNPYMNDGLQALLRSSVGGSHPLCRILVSGITHWIQTGGSLTSTLRSTNIRHICTHLSTVLYPNRSTFPANFPFFHASPSSVRTPSSKIPMYCVLSCRSYTDLLLTDLPTLSNTDILITDLPLSVLLTTVLPNTEILFPASNYCPTEYRPTKYRCTEYCLVELRPPDYRSTNLLSTDYRSTVPITDLPLPVLLTTVYRILNYCIPASRLLFYRLPSYSLPASQLPFYQIRDY